MVHVPDRNRRIFPGIRLDEVEDDYFPANTIEVNGESFHKSELLEIHRFMGNQADVFSAVDAFLLAEPSNPYDSNAVAVYVHEKKVGYIPKEISIFCSEFVQRDGGQGFWVQAAIKYISSLDQFRVRLLAEFPFVRDLNVIPFVSAEHLPAEKFSTFLVTREKFDFASIPWRTEHLGRGKTLMFAGPFPAIFENAGTWVEWNEAQDSPHDGGWAVSITFLGQRWTTIDSKEAPDLVNFVLDSGGLARTQAHLVWDQSSSKYPEFTFSTSESVQPERIHPDAVYSDLLLAKEDFEWASSNEEDIPF